MLSEDGTTKVFQVDGSHRVEEVCRQMVARNNALNDKSWSLVEELTELDLGKTCSSKPVIHVCMLTVLTQKGICGTMLSC